MDWTALEDALHAWVVASTGYASNRVLWRDQDANAKVADRITLHISGPIVLGTDERVSATDLLEPAGQEITLSVRGDREWSLQVECYTGATTTTSDAKSILSKLQTVGQLPSKLALLDAQGISLFDLGSVQYTPEIREVAYQGRALLLMRFYSRDVASEKTGYIAEVEITDTVAARTFIAP